MNLLYLFKLTRAGELNPENGGAVRLFVHPFIPAMNRAGTGNVARSGMKLKALRTTRPCLSGSFPGPPACPDR